MAARSYRQYCALARALDVIGDRWTMLILRNLLLGPLTWSALVQTLPGIAKNLLAARLAELEGNGLIAHESDRYRLTEVGAGLEPALFALSDWGEKHFMGPPRPQEALRLRYLMTSVRRKIRPSAEVARVQLWIGGTPYVVQLGAEPTVEAAEAAADAEVRCDLAGLKAVLLTREDPQALVARGEIEVDGDPRAIDAMQRALGGEGR